MAQFNASSLLYKRQFRYLTGVTPDIFRQMAERLRPSWDRRCQRKKRSGRPWGVGGLPPQLTQRQILNYRRNHKHNRRVLRERRKCQIAP